MILEGRQLERPYLQAREPLAQDLYELSSRLPPITKPIWAIHTDEVRPGFAGMLWAVVLPDGAVIPRQVRLSAALRASVGWLALEQPMELQAVMLRVWPHDVAAYAQAVFNFDGSLHDWCIVGNDQPPAESASGPIWRARKYACLGASAFGGRRVGSRTGMDYETWLQLARRLRHLVRHQNVTVEGAIARIQLNLSRRQGYTWLSRINELEPNSCIDSCAAAFVAN